MWGLISVTNGNSNLGTGFFCERGKRDGGSEVGRFGFDLMLICEAES